MQLFTIGPVQLDDEGTPRLDANGEQVEMYTNDDILDFSRAWTGYRKQLYRSNIEAWRSNTARTPRNIVDPMRLQPMWRDPFPAVGLAATSYVGDGYPLCIDLPSRGFLRKGAVLSYIGPSVSDCDAPTDCPISGQQPTCCSSEGGKDYIMLNHDGAYLTVDNHSSLLLQKLCGRAPGDSSQPCNLQSQITLTETLACNGNECDVDTVHVIKLLDGATAAFYEWHRPACVEFPFYSDAKVVTTSRFGKKMCADPQTEAAGSCCLTSSGRAAGKCSFPKQRMTYAMNEARCAANSLSACADDTRSPPNGDMCGYYSRYMKTWTQQSCTLRARVDSRGWVSIVHEPFVHDTNFLKGGRGPDFAADSQDLTSFRVLWEDGLFPTTSDGCASDCTVAGDTCLCDVEVETTRVFDAVPTTSAQVKASTAIGSLCPDAFDDDEYSLLGGNSEVEAHALAADPSGGGFNTKTIIRVIATGDCYANRRSIVKIGAGAHGSGLFFFRNAPHFVSFTHPMSRDAYHQTEAMIDHLVSQPNTASFIAHRLIQRFTSSNPSPRYLRAVADAFRTGTYAGVSYGEYGDLGATIAAVLLDEEARSTTLDADPSHGKLREPLLKVHARARVYFHISPPHLLTACSARLPAPPPHRYTGTPLPSCDGVRIEGRSAGRAPLGGRPYWDAGAPLSGRVQLLSSRLSASWTRFACGALCP